MGLIAPKTAELVLLEYMVGKVLGNEGVTGQILHLYSNDMAPDPDTVLADFTEVNVTTGYAPATLTYASWTHTTDGNGVATAIYSSEVTFSFTTSLDVYGYYVTNNNKLLWTEMWSGAPFSMPISGGTIAIQPKLLLN
jgi:hypothetical protein